MAAQLVTTIKRYIGTAAEIAAMTLTGIPAGSTFFESDTGILKVLNAAGALVTAPSETVSLSGSIVAEQQTQADAADGVLTFTENINYIEIYNTDAGNAGTFEVNGITINVPATKVFKTGIGGTPAKTVTITGATTYIVSRYV